MRFWIVVMVAASSVIGWSAPSWAQSNPVEDQIDSILLDERRDIEPALTYPEVIIQQQYGDISTFFEALYDQFVPEPPISNRDLVTPYQASVASQAGYYRVTLTEPPIELALPQTNR